jgi:hypothetical protein
MDIIATSAFKGLTHSLYVVMIKDFNKYLNICIVYHFIIFIYLVSNITYKFKLKNKNRKTDKVLLSIKIQKWNFITVF